MIGLTFGKNTQRTIAIEDRLQEEIKPALDKMDKRFDRVDDKFDQLNERLAKLTDVLLKKQ